MKKSLVHTHKSEIIDVTTNATYPSSKPSVEEQIATLEAIQAYNKALPKRRKIKDSLPEIHTSNVAATYQVKRTIKRKEVKIEMETKYKPVGIVDGAMSADGTSDPYSLETK